MKLHFLLLSLLVLMSACDGGKSPATYDPQLAKEEGAHPIEFLKVDGQYHREGKSMVIEGDITNIATSASFKNAVLIAAFFPEGSDQAQLGGKKVLEGTLIPGESKHFKYEFEVGPEIAKAGFQVFDAELAESDL